MAKRYYRVEFLHPRKGWTVLPQGYDGLKEANDIAEQLASERCCPTRTKRAPKGWTPLPEKEQT